MKSDRKIIFSTQSYIYLKKKICEGNVFDTGEVEVKQFPDGERYQRVLSDVDCREVVLVGGTISDADTLELYDLACTLVSLGAQSLTLIIPYFGYSTMERAVYPGEVVTAKTRAYLLSTIPGTPTKTGSCCWICIRKDFPIILKEKPGPCICTPKP